MQQYLGDIDYEEFHSYLENTVFVVKDIMQTKKSFKSTHKRLYNYMKQGFEKPEVRKHPLKFRFSSNTKERVKTMQIRHFIVNMILWYPFTKFDAVEDLNDSCIFDCDKLTLKRLNEYINDKLIIPYRREIEFRDMNKALDTMIYLLSRINYDFADIMGTTLDMESFIAMGDRHPRFKELMCTEIPDGMQPKEIEDYLSHNLNEYIKIIEDDGDNNILPFLAAGVGLHRGQLSQFAINGGLKPDIEGNVIPSPINSSYLNKGLNTIQNFYIDGQAGSKPIILNKTAMGRSGHFAYKTMTLSSNYVLSQTVKDCNSARPIMFEVVDSERLKRIKGRYYIGEDGELHCIDHKKDKHLIGKTIALRDPVTCCSPDGVCHICYGDAYYINNSPNFNAGGYAATQINNPVEQNILSAKHITATKSTKLDYDEDFNRFFVLDSNKIKLNLNSDESFKDWYMLVDNEDYFIVDEMNKDADFNYYTEKFTMYNRDTGEAIVLQEKNKHDVFFSSDVTRLIKKYDDQYVGVRIDKIPEECELAKINIVNSEVTTPLKNIMKLLDRVEHYGCETIDAMVNKLCQLTIESGIDLDSTHCSMVIKGLIRRTDDILMEPDWSDPEECENYKIHTLTNALIFNPSLTVSISFESMNKQITNPSTFRKYSKSKYDMCYEEDLYIASQRFYNERKREKYYRKLAKLARKMKKKRGHAAAKENE